MVLRVPTVSVECARGGQPERVKYQLKAVNNLLCLNGGFHFMVFLLVLLQPIPLQPRGEKSAVSIHLSTPAPPQSCAEKRNQNI